RCWRIAGLTDKFIDTLPAQMMTGPNWYIGTADAIYQNLELISSVNPDLVCIFGGDHIYTMDVRSMVNFHQESDAVLTVAAIPVPVSEAHHFGVIEVDSQSRMVGFVEKPRSNPKTIPGNPHYVLASMGNYVFNCNTLERELIADNKNTASDHDFGKNIIPSLFSREKVMVYNFANNEVPGATQRGYWRDVGTIDAYWEANMDLLSANPPIDLHNLKWPINTYIPPFPPALIDYHRDHREGRVNNSMVGTGCIFSDVFMDNTVTGYNVVIGNKARISDSVILPNVTIGENCVIHKAIIDKRAEIAPGTQIGVNLEQDRKHFKVTESGIVVIPRRAKVGF
ncbi:MAG: glucose-1-phosphate adenylyltransferase, partial [Bacteroidales bacterium]|nr:glucose-1-phosphate adenylyltransferase [Bacteroidales bacterium]